MLKPFSLKSSSDSPKTLFSSIVKNVRFEAESEENAKNDNNSGQQNSNTNDDSGKDASLDASLDKLKQKNTNKKEEGDDESSASSDTSDGGSGEEIPTEDSGSNTPESEGSEDPAGNSSDVQQDDPSSNTPDTPSTDGPRNRRLTLYTEFNRIYNGLKESVSSLSSLQTSDDNIKSCVAQLQDIVSDASFILSQFSSYSENDMMIQLQLIKDRSKITLEQLSRIKTAEDK